MEQLKQRISSAEEFDRLRRWVAKASAGDSITIDGAAGSLLAMIAAASFEKRNSTILLITSDAEKAGTLRDDCAAMLGDDALRLLGHRPTHEARVIDMEATLTLIEALQMLGTAQPCVVVASPESIVGRLPRPEQFSRRTIELTVATEFPFTQLISSFDELGFDRKDFVEGYGDYAVRGGIVDVFPFIGTNPIRIEFWGDTIESIREFDILSQRSIKELHSATIVPDIDERSSKGTSGIEGIASVFDYLPADTLILLDEPEIIANEIVELEREGIEIAFDWKAISDHVAKFPVIEHAAFRTHTITADRISFGGVSQPSFNGSIKALLSETGRLQREGIAIHFTCDTETERARLNELIEEEQAEMSEAPISIAILTGTLHAGFVFPHAGIAVFTEHQIFGRKKRRGSGARRRFKGITAKDLKQLRRGDFVTHLDHGVGRYAGLEKIRIGGAEQEAMKIVYQDDDALYVNLNYIDRVQKYSAQEGRVPALSKLGGADWERLKARAKRKIKDIARDLIRLYARRKLEKGFGFSPDSHWQKEMEASFTYEDTVDQAKATLDVKQDMESEAPMDRLICGDVGFGKTEVAVRAAFKAVLDGKQVAVLVPTTILAEQHYRTFLDRLGRYTVRVEFLSRFKSKKQQKEIVEALAERQVDVVIGTHRLISKDVQFKELGLLIIDEEHRFGVAAKEKLRQLKANVDTLTLTATPIPRTLQFSLLGARDISLINTPPRNRLAIVTEIVSYDWKIIREGVLRELHRGGQVFFVHDRVHNIDAIQNLFHQHLPDVRVAIAHGQMRGHDLEQVIVDFLERRFDVLISTKIIESGIDMPNVNTILINRADNFGLAELYQLRGRVGRSNVQAYAYLMTPPFSVLSKETIRRLQAIEEFTELGSGFNLAMRDLEIRGAGNLLGGEQSGFIVEMGFEMYERIMREAVEELRREEFADTIPETAPALPAAPVPTLIETDVDAFIPDIYVQPQTERLDIYRRLSQITSRAEVEEIRAELQDRFGEYPPEVEHVCIIVELKLLATQLRLRKLSLQSNRLILLLPGEEDSAFYDAPEGQPSLFKTLVDRAAQELNVRHRLKQEGKSLFLVLEGHFPAGGTERLRLCRELVARFTGS